MRGTSRYTLDFRPKRGASEEEIARLRAQRDALLRFLTLATTALNVGTREVVRADAELLDDHLARHGKMPRGQDIVWPKLYSYPLMRRVSPELLSGIVATLSRQVDEKWKSERWEVLIAQKRSAPHYRVGGAIGIPESALRFEANAGGAGDGVTLTFSPYSRDVPDRERLVLRLLPRDARQKIELENLASGEWRMGDVKLSRDKSAMSRFYIRISYRRRVPLKTEGIAAGINRGLRTFLAMATSAGDQLLYDGADIEAFLKQVQRRRQDYQRASRMSGRGGHGRRRILRPVEPLEAKARNYRQTRNQTIARRAAIWLSEKGVQHLYIEDFEGIRRGEPELAPGGRYIWERIQEWPFHDLASRLTSCAREMGIQVHVVAPAYISTTCPACGHEAPENRDLVRWRLKCGACGRAGHLDVAAARNVMARGEVARLGGGKDIKALRSAHVSKKAAARGGRRKGSEGKGPRETGGGG